MGRGSARTLQHWINLGYSIEEAEKMRRSRTPGTIEYYIIFKKMTTVDAENARKEFQHRRAITLDNFISKYGNIDGEIRWQQYKDKQAYSNSFEYKRDKHGWDIETYNKYNISRGNTGENNGNFASSYYHTWVTKYGKDAADKMNNIVTLQKRRIGADNGNWKRKKRPDELRKMRESAIQRVIRQGVYTAYNPNSIPIIEQYGRTNGYNFQHAENGGEFHVPNTTFMVDGYDSEKNVVIEYDEVYHTSEAQQKKDLQRQCQIGIELRCKFIRINSKFEVAIFDYI